jgi:hypothetical protein
LLLNVIFPWFSSLSSSIRDFKWVKSKFYSISLLITLSWKWLSSAFLDRLSSSWEWNFFMLIFFYEFDVWIFSFDNDVLDFDFDKVNILESLRENDGSTWKFYLIRWNAFQHIPFMRCFINSRAFCLL